MVRGPGGGVTARSDPSAGHQAPLDPLPSPLLSSTAGTPTITKPVQPVMALPLPVELLNHVLALVNAGASLSERQVNRQRFGRVCRAWWASVDWWSEVVVVGEAGLVSLKNNLKANGVDCLLRCHTLSVALDLDWLAQAEVARLLKRTANLATLHLAHLATAAGSLMAGPLNQAASLPSLRHLSLCNLTIETEFKTGWAALTSLTLHGGDLASAPIAGQVYASRRAHIPAHYIEWYVAWYWANQEALFFGLPPLQKSAFRRRYRPRDPALPPLPLLPPPPPPAKVRAVAPAFDVPRLGHLAGRLEHLALTGAPMRQGQVFWPPMPRLRSLAVDGASSDQLPFGAGSLPGLGRLELRADGRLLDHWAKEALTSRVALTVDCYGALGEVKLGRSDWDSFSPRNRERVQAAVARHSVRLVIA